LGSVNTNHLFVTDFLALIAVALFFFLCVIK